MNLRKWLEKEDFSLALSAGFFSFYAHAGFVKALFENKLRPRRFMGSSAGALLSALICAGHEISEIESILATIKKSDFWDFGPGLGLLKGKLFRKLLEKHLPQNFDHLTIPLTVAAHPLFGVKPRHFSKGDLISAVHASCCFPGLFHPVKINGSLFIDGGVTDWAGAHHALPTERLLIHHIKPSGPHRRYVEKQIRRLGHPNRKVISLSGLMEMSPECMSQGLQAIEEAYQKTMLALEQKVEI
jgi:NTE family protein